MVYKPTCNWGAHPVVKPTFCFQPPRELWPVPNMTSIVTAFFSPTQYVHFANFDSVILSDLPWTSYLQSKKYPDVSVLGELRLTVWENLKPVYKLHRTHAVPGGGRRNAVRLSHHSVFSKIGFELISMGYINWVSPFHFQRFSGSDLAILPQMRGKRSGDAWVSLFAVLSLSPYMSLWKKSPWNSIAQQRSIAEQVPGPVMRFHGFVWTCWVNLPNEIAIFHRDNDH